MNPCLTPGWAPASWVKWKVRELCGFNQISSIVNKHLTLDDNCTNLAGPHRGEAGVSPRLGGLIVVERVQSVGGGLSYKSYFEKWPPSLSVDWGETKYNTQTHTHTHSCSEPWQKMTDTVVAEGQVKFRDGKKVNS